MHYSREQIEAAQTPAELQAILSAAGSSPRWTVATLTEVAEFFSCAHSTVKGWRCENPPMPGSDAGWPLDAIVRWRIDRLKSSDLATAQKEATLESTQLANDAKRLELAKERGELVERREAELWASVACCEAREQLMQLPELLATSAPPELRDFIRAETDRHVRDTLTALRRRLESDELDKQTTTGSVADDDDSNPMKEETTNAHDA